MDAGAVPPGPTTGSGWARRWRGALPSGVGGLLLAVIFMLAVGAGGAVIGGWYGWRAAPPLPSDAALRQLVGVAGAGQGATVSRRQEGTFGYDPPVTSLADRVLVPLLGGDGYVAGHVELTCPLPSDPPAALRAARDRLTTTGWQRGAVHVDAYGQSFWARRGGLVTSWQIENTVSDDGVQPGRYQPTLSVSARRSDPAPVRWGILAGWLIGILVAVPALVLVTRRTRAGRSRRSVRPLAWAGLLALVPAVAWTSLIVTSYLISPHPVPDEPAPPWIAVMVFPFRPLAFAGAVLLAVALYRALTGPAGALDRPGVSG